MARTSNDAGYGITPREWAGPQDKGAGGNSPASSPGPAVAHNADDALLAVEVEALGEALAHGCIRLPTGSVVYGDGIARKATHITLFPLEPLTVEAAVKAGLIDMGGVRWAAYEAAVRHGTKTQGRQPA
jgi:hypothetical protein